MLIATLVQLVRHPTNNILAEFPSLTTSPIEQARQNNSLQPQPLIVPMCSTAHPTFAAARIALP
jgi:hypothetical protein